MSTEHTHVVPSADRSTISAGHSSRVGVARRVGRTEGSVAPPVVDDVVRSPGRSLDLETRASMEARFGHDFSRVRIHTGPRAAEAVRAVDARAFTVGPDVVFDQGLYEPRTTTGKRLLAHELAHVVQQDGATRTRPSAGLPLRLSAGRGSAPEAAADRAADATVTGSVSGGSIGRQQLAVQRQEGSEEEQRRFLGPGGRPMFQLQLDPQIEAQAMAYRLRNLLNPEMLSLTLSQMDLDSVIRTSPPAWVTAPTVPAPAPLVPRGVGPDTPRPAGAGDVLRGIMRVPAVDAALTNLQTAATDRLSREWRSLSTGEKVVVVSQSVLLGGGVLAGVVSNPEARTFVLGQLQNRSLPTGIPGLNFQFNVTGPDQRLQLDLNVGALLPRSWGFR
jgi:Domain of unknown function (DUF4157)